MRQKMKARRTRVWVKKRNDHISGCVICKGTIMTINDQIPRCRQLEKIDRERR